MRSISNSGPPRAGLIEVSAAGLLWGPDEVRSQSNGTSPTRATRISVVAHLLVAAAPYLGACLHRATPTPSTPLPSRPDLRAERAFFFGSLDAGNAITVDKPPTSLWLMALSVGVFGLSLWSILVPQALLDPDPGCGTDVALQRRRAAGVQLTAATYLTLCPTEKASGRWLVGAGVLISFAFLTKMPQAFLVLPDFALVYLVAPITMLSIRPVGPPPFLLTAKVASQP